VWIPGARPNGLYALGDDEAHHAVRVLRRRAGDEVVVVAGSGVLLLGRIESTGDTDDGTPRVTVRTEEALAPAPDVLVPWSIAVAPVKDRRFDDAVRMASELGLEGLLPVITERCEVRPSRSRGGSGSTSGKEARWRRVATESAKQCGRSPALAIGATTDLAALLEEERGGDRTLWVAHPSDAAPPGLPAEFVGADARALFLVGPEGGFAPREIEAIETAGGRAIALPTPVLRTPTAVALIAALGVFARVGQ